MGYWVGTVVSLFMLTQGPLLSSRAQFNIELAQYISLILSDNFFFSARRKNSIGQSGFAINR